MSELILITGVSGFIGFHTLVLALEAGYTVRATIRKSSQIAKLSSHHRVQPYIKQLEFVVVPDLTDISVLIENLKGVTGVLHLASPLAVQTQDYERDIVKPALSITSSILTAASKIPSIKRVVITSSAVTLIPFEWLSSPDASKLYTSKDINSNPSTPYASSMEAYWSSKALSRMAAHSFIEKRSSTLEIIQLLPSVVIGPDLLAEKPADIMSGTRTLALAPILGDIIPYPLVGVPVHVIDVAKAHICALHSTVPGNKDYILSSNTPEGINWNDGIEIAKKWFPEAVDQGILKLGGNLPTQKFRLGTEEMERSFGWSCRGFEETIKDLVGLYVELVEVERKETGA